MSGARTETVTFKVSPETLEAIEQHRGGTTRSSWMAEAAEAHLASEPHPPAPEPPPPPADVVTDEVAEAEETCDHPRDRRVRKPYGTICLDCGRLVR